MFLTLLVSQKLIKGTKTYPDGTKSEGEWGWFAGNPVAAHWGKKETKYVTLLGIDKDFPIGWFILYVGFIFLLIMVGLAIFT